ncbi:hypothetical protein BS17DRAFT_780637 [Gyrodon lividus]|nr:hypothetical protein BS17DRAFT_780637 [Gyrodon lividus]
MAQSANLRKIDSDNNVDSFFKAKIDADGRLSSGVSFQSLTDDIKKNKLKPLFPPLDCLPCANVQADQYVTCKNRGKSSCSACKLVSYCSQECQKKHWKIHKRDCKAQIRSDEWQPAWIVERRAPKFVDDSSGPSNAVQGGHHRLDYGVPLWGNVPAMDIVNLQNNEVELSRDLSLAFIASGDLRHVVRTVNALGSDYSGHLKILINDRAWPVVSRNITLLLILGTIPDEVLAADIALHFWYSVFMPVEYRIQISHLLTHFLLKISPAQSLPQPLGNHSNLTCTLTAEIIAQLRNDITSSMSMDQAQNEYDRVQNSPSRLDFWHRFYIGLKPSHRFACLEFRRFGIVLPFGAMNAHFNTPNTSLFSLAGEWLQTDFANPLKSWDTDAVIDAGKAHGATSEDIYGCLYFMLSDELRTFARRIRTLHISFHVFGADACVLSDAITHGELTAYGIPPTTRFDRVEVSNILDPNYVGIQGVLDSWEPLLSTSVHATIVGYFLNWIMFQEGGKVGTAGHSVFKKIVRQMMEDEKFSAFEKRKGPLNIHDTSKIHTVAYTLLGNTDALYDNAKAFRTFLKAQGLPSALRTTKLKRRDEHRIFPYRIKVPLEGKEEDLPAFADAETWYRYTRLSGASWSERFVEFSRG